MSVPAGAVVPRRVTLLGRDGARTSFDCLPGTPIAAAATRAGVRMTLGCQQGRCAICASRLVEGEARALSGTPQQGGADRIYPCRYTPVTDLVVEPLGPWSRDAAARSIG